MYMAYIPHILDPIEGKGPSLLTVFGIDGTMTLLWSYVLTRPEWAGLVRDTVARGKPRVVVGRFEPRFPNRAGDPENPEAAPEDFSFVRPEDLELKIDVELPLDIVGRTALSITP